MMKSIFILLVVCSLSINAFSQPISVSEEFSLHAQTTVIDQYKPSFKSTYTGPNSLNSVSEDQRTFTSTLFLGARLWKGGSFYINPEISAGLGLSKTSGIAAFPNGEAFRVGNPEPQMNFARYYIRQLFSFDRKYDFQQSDINHLRGPVPSSFIGITIGKISLTDFFDQNKYSHDPRTQFMSWGLMDNGAWDFAANTKGYTPTALIEYVTPKFEIRYGFSLIATTANGMTMNWNIAHAGAHNLEGKRIYSIGKREGSLRLMLFYNTGKFGNYTESFLINPLKPDLEASKKYGRNKYGFGINLEQEVTDYAGVFLRAGWNDGKNETWSFTEVDRTLSFGFLFNGAKWNRKDDSSGFGYVLSGISPSHRLYLQAGGSGMILGDGQLNYAPEQLTEIFYSFLLRQYIYLSGAWQFILNPGYNNDRGPVNILSIRVHLII